MKVVKTTIYITEGQDKKIEELVKSGEYKSKAEFIRTAIRELLEKYRSQ